MNDLGKGIAGFGEGFLKTLQSERERKRKEEEFNQEMGYRVRQMNLLDAYKNQDLQIAKEDLIRKKNQPYETKDGTVFPQNNGLIDFSNPLYQPPMTTKPISQLLGTGSYGGRSGLKYGYRDDKSEVVTKFDEFSGQGGDKTTNGNNNGLGDNSDISQEMGELKQLVEFFDRTGGLTEGELEYTDASGNTREMDYNLWKSAVSKPLNDMLTKAGVPMNGEMVSNIRRVAGIKPGDSRELKRKKLKSALYKVKPNLRDDQYNALYQWTEVGTR